MVANKGHQYVIPGGVHVDGESAATNNDQHLTMMVPFQVDVAGVMSTLPDSDRLVYVNLERDGDGWLVSAVLPPTAIPEGYATASFSARSQLATGEERP